MKKAVFSTRTGYGIPGSTALVRVLPMLGMLLLVALLAIFFGLLASTANPLFVTLGASLLVGALLLVKPDWNIWFILILGLLVVGVVSIWTEGYASKAHWGVSLLGFVLLVSALFRAATTPQAVRSTPAFVWLALVFMLFTLLNSLMQWSSLFEVATGFKRYYQVIGLLFAFAWLNITEQQVQLWRIFFIIVALIQLPWAIYELVELVPIREGFQYTGLVPIDVVAGTFGATLYSGGASSEMATFLIIVLAFLLARRQEKLLGLRKYLLLLPFVLAPLFIGETKVVVILLPLMFLTLYRHELIRRPYYAFLGLLMGTLLTVAAGLAYVDVTNAKSLDALVTDTMEYNIHEQGYGGLVLNRTTVLTFWAKQHGVNNPDSTVFGNGLGATHFSTNAHLAKRYPGYGIGLTVASTLLWEQGLVGTALYLAIFASAWITAGRLRRVAIPPWMRADAVAIQAALVLFAFFLFYRSTLLESIPFQIVFFSLLGYLAWLNRQHATRATTVGA
jgi:hypothetical protein